MRVAPKFCLEIRGVRKATIENKQKQNANYFKENKNGAMPKKRAVILLGNFITLSTVGRNSFKFDKQHFKMNGIIQISKQN